MDGPMPWWLEGAPPDPEEPALAGDAETDVAIVEGPVGMPVPPFGGRGWKHGRGRGRHRKFFIARFDDGAKEVMVQAQKEADSLKHNYVGTEHLMLAVLRRGIEGLDVDAARKQV